MSKEELHNDMLYHAAISMTKTMLENGLITEEEYAEIDTILLEKIPTIFGYIIIRKRLIFLPFRVIYRHYRKEGFH